MTYSVIAAEAAPHAHPARWKDDLAQAGLLARGSSPFPAFPGLALQSPVAFGERLTADSCGGSFGFGALGRTEFPLGRSTQPAHLNFLIARYFGRVVNITTLFLAGV
jgi:hypothetical protein